MASNWLAEISADLREAHLRRDATMRYTNTRYFTLLFILFHVVL